MKIGFDFRMGGSINAGIGRYSLELLVAMLKQNSGNVFVVFYNEHNSNPKDINTLKSLGATLVPANYRLFSFAEQLFFPKLLNSYNLDIVHFPNFNIPIRYKKPFVVTIHDMVHHKISGHKKSRLWKYYAYLYIIKKAAHNSLNIISVTEPDKKEIIDYLGVEPEKVIVTYEAPAVNDAKPVDVLKIKEKYLLSRPYFLFVVTLERKKNLPMLVKAFD